MKFQDFFFWLKRIIFELGGIMLLILKPQATSLPHFFSILRSLHSWHIDLIVLQSQARWHHGALAFSVPFWNTYLMTLSFIWLCAQLSPPQRSLPDHPRKSTALLFSLYIALLLFVVLITAWSDVLYLFIYFFSPQ